jgi:hypothetical protein
MGFRRRFWRRFVGAKPVTWRRYHPGLLQAARTGFRLRWGGDVAPWRAVGRRQAGG